VVVNDTYRVGVTVFRCKWYENLAGPGYRVNGPGQRIALPAPASDLPRRKPPPRRRDLEVILDYDAVTPLMIARWCSRALTRRPMIRLLVSSHVLEADRKRGLVLQFKHPLDAVAFKMDFRQHLSAEEW
jgi:hypothetical protein